MPDARWTKYVPKDIPQRAHPAVQKLFANMRAQQTTYEQLAQRSGVSAWTIRRWRRGQLPELGNLEACLNVYGYTIVAQRKPGVAE